MVRISNLKKIADRAKQEVDKRGGTDALKADLKEVGNAVKGEGSIKDKAKNAAEAVKRPGKNTAAKGTKSKKTAKPATKTKAKKTSKATNASKATKAKKA